jgi:hypothetical protein
LRRSSKVSTTKEPLSSNRNYSHRRNPLADAERSLQKKETKKALNDQRVASKKITWALGKMADIKRTEIIDRDAYIFPVYFAPVIVNENGKRAIKLMRYQCRPSGTPKFLDKQLDTLKWQPLDTIAASSRSRKRTSRRGSIPIRRISTRCRRFLKIGRGRITSIGWQRESATADVVFATNSAFTEMRRRHS